MYRIILSSYISSLSVLFVIFFFFFFHKHYFLDISWSLSLLLHRSHNFNLSLPFFFEITGLSSKYPDEFKIITARFSKESTFLLKLIFRGYILTMKSLRKSSLTMLFWTTLSYRFKYLLYVCYSWIFFLYLFYMYHCINLSWSLSLSHPKNQYHVNLPSLYSPKHYLIINVHKYYNRTPNILEVKITIFLQML